MLAAQGGEMKPGVWVLLLVLGAFVWLLVSLSGRPAGPATVGATRAPAPAAGLELVGEPSVLTKQYGLRDAVGRVRNTDTEPRSGFVNVTLFDAEGKIIGTANGAVPNLQPGEEATYSGAIGTAVPEVARIEARVGSQYRVRT
jgi:hypothetical protein